MKDSGLWSYDYERCSLLEGQRCGVLGIDEAGRGSWVGPVVAAAAYILPEAYTDERLRGGCHLINDSKQLKRSEREELFALLGNWRTAGLLRLEAGQADVAEIEAHNIVGATALAMRRAVDALQLPYVLPAGACIKVGGKRPQKAVSYTANTVQTDLFSGLSTPVDAVGAGESEPVDVLQGKAASGRLVDLMPPHAGANAIHPPQVWVDGIPMPKRLPFAHEGIVSGDGTSLAIAIASIWAKVTRDRMLEDLALEFPLYGWETNAGYGTPTHVSALRTHGACPHHRKKFLQKQGLA